MRASMAYFAGAGTVIVAIAAGLGGGVLISDIMGSHGTRELSKLEQRTASQQAQPSPAQSPQANAASGAYLAATTQTATTPATVAPAPSNSPQPRTESNSAAPPEAPASAKPDATASTDTAKPAQASTPQPPPPAPQQASRDPASSTDNAYAKARDADLKQLEAKKKADRAERRQQWAARRAQQREQERRDAEQQANEERRPGEIIVRRDDRDDSDRPEFGRPMRLEFPRINLFGQD